MATIDFILTMLKSRLLVLSCSSCLSSFFLAGFSFASPISSFFRSTTDRERKRRDLSWTFFSTKLLLLPCFETRALYTDPLTSFTLFFDSGFEPAIVVCPVYQDIEKPCTVREIVILLRRFSLIHEFDT